jgi:hypothetical protein
MSHWGTPVIFVDKRDGGRRMCGFIETWTMPPSRKNIPYQEHKICLIKSKEQEFSPKLTEDLDTIR